MAQGGNSACNSTNGTFEPDPVAVTTATATTFATALTGYDVYLCWLVFVLPEGNTYQLQCTDGHVIDGPHKLANAGAVAIPWDGQKTSRACTIGSGIQLKLANSPSVQVSVTATFYRLTR